MDDNRQTNYLNKDKLSSSEHPVSNRADSTTSIMPWVIQFRIVGTPSIVQIPTRENIIIGRSDPDRNIKVDVDMSRFDGQKKGVSRRHAELGTNNNRITITDLDSANGTFINDQVLSTHHPYRLRDGDRLKLGELDMQVNFIVRPYMSDETMVGFENHLDIPKVGRKQHILVLDADQPTCDVVSMIITHANFQVSKAYSIEEAIRIIDSDTPPDGIFLELLLQGEDGMDVVRYYRQHIGHDKPIVAMTSVTAGYQMEQAFGAGVDIFIAKPVAIEELNTTLSKIADILRQE